MNFREFIRQMFQRTSEVPSTPRGGDFSDSSRSLRRAAQHVENCAYDLAADIDSDLVSEMIIIAADLERLANAVDRKGKS